MNENTFGNSPEPMLLTPREAAATLRISEKSLWSYTVPRGSIPFVRWGKRGVRYSPAALRHWIESQQQAAASV